MFVRIAYHLLGLFAPRAGQVFRESQRRRRSQFDRGTNLAQIEESSFIGENEGVMIGNTTTSDSQSEMDRHVRF